MKTVRFIVNLVVAILHITLTLVLAIGFLAFIIPGVLAQQSLKS
ncbi:MULTISPECIES: hypothetical protein [Spirosoma]|nr:MULTISPECIES: hypothetical protein [Spirosoma]